ncbi:MAG: hypothetical protein OSJ54_13155 [Oscillospiraceae bacterium]|nr:hypothetical protein [Oscillospiraceae bacterium]
MKALDRLIIKAKKKCGVDRLEVGFISTSETEPGKWVATGQIWNGIPGSGVTSASCLCNSIEEAEAALQELGEKYPNNKDVAIFIEDIAE